MIELTDEQCGKLNHPEPTALDPRRISQFLKSGSAISEPLALGEHQ
jgi:hypothetical protein